MAAETPRLSTQPLLDSSYFKKSPQVSLRALEDGDDFSSDDEEIRPRPGFLKRLRMSVRRRNGTARVDYDFKSIQLPDEKKQVKKYRMRRKYVARACVIVPLLVVIFFGTLHVLNVFLGYTPIFRDDHPGSLDWTRPDKASSDIASSLLDITRDVTPIPCHSHNDYWRQVPLYDALRWGCTGVEADVWLFDSELYVGHHTNSLTPNRTFQSMYVDPLVKMLDHKNALNDMTSPKAGVFSTSPSQTLVLLIDFKNNGTAIFPMVSRQLSALREKGYLTHFNGTATIQGAITVVATGGAPFDLLTANTTYRDVFFDAPLDRIYQESLTQYSRPHLLKRTRQGTIGTTPTSHFDTTNSYYASVKFSNSIGWLWFGYMSEAQKTKIRGQIRAARARGLKARYWSAPKWPVGLRNKVWDLLVEEEVGVLNGDDLGGMSRLDWGVRGRVG